MNKLKAMSRKKRMLCAELILILFALPVLINGSSEGVS